MAKMKVTVLRRMANPDFAEQYCKRADVTLCPLFTEGQEFVVDESFGCPENFPCSGAWNSMSLGMEMLMLGLNYPNWMKDEKTLIQCCTDGIRPVVFKLERIED